jgi:CRP/FNR family transcriptional regulator, cyclic AMP receptor protein
MLKTLPIEALKPIPLFQGFTESEFLRLQALAEQSTFRPGELVVEQDRLSQNLWILLEGTCEVFRQETGGEPSALPLVLATLEPYAAFGEMSFFQTAPHSASVRAQTRVRLLCLTKSQFDELLERDSAVACKLAINTIHILAQRMRRMDQWVAELMQTKPASQNVREWARLHEQLFNTWQL